jgi:hypothetical protein
MEWPSGRPLPPLSVHLPGPLHSVRSINDSDDCIQLHTLGIVSVHLVQIFIQKIDACEMSLRKHLLKLGCRCCQDIELWGWGCWTMRPQTCFHLAFLAGKKKKEYAEQKVF